MMPPPDVQTPCRYMPPGTPCPYPGDCVCNREETENLAIPLALMAGIGLAIAVGLVAIYHSIEPAHGADNLAPCLTRAQAKAKYPGRWLYWHTAQHCWDDQKTRRQYAPAPRIPVAHALAPQPANVTQGPTIAYPTTMGGVGTDTSMLRPDAMTSWPVVFDFDDEAPRFVPWSDRITGNDHAPD